MKRRTERHLVFDLHCVQKEKTSTTVSFIASEEVTLQLVKSKCLPILLYGLECYSMLKADLHSIP